VSLDLIASLIPFIGTGFVWIPVALIKIADGFVAGDNFTALMGIGLLIYGTGVISVIDNILKPKLIGSKANINPLIILLGMLGGVTIFGIVGLIAGPLILALTVTLIEIYKTEVQ
jgi:predicted PurR-regulated permease PerM